MVIAVVAVNVAVFLIEQTNFNSIVDRFAMEPLEVHHQPYRLITAAFLHANVEHILFNMLALVIIGPSVEVVVGKVRFVAIYLLAALGGSVFSYLLSPDRIAGLGASGAIFGVMGAYFVLACRNKWDTSQVLALIVVNLLIGVVISGIDWRAHIGGLLTGAAVGLGFSYTASPAQARLAGEEQPSPLSPGARTGIEVVICAVVLLGLVGLLQLPPGHVNL